MEARPWIIFDADNTLWLIEHLYDEARRELCRYVHTKGAAEADVDKFQRARDQELYASYGYTACRFARSFEDTILHFAPSAVPDEIRHARSLALSVFERQATPVGGLDALLKTLRPHYVFGVITAGERWVQERRLKDFPLREMFDAIRIVERKDSGEFLRFCDEYGIDRARSWVVGDSLKSDVLPAQEAGLRAVWVRAANWTAVEGTTAAVPLGIVAIETLADLAKVPGVLEV
jgi:putative hydrolase of the HAD superfamily